MSSLDEKETKQIDSWTGPEGPVALVLHQKMLPAEGSGGVIFPPTYAEVGYNTDVTPEGEEIATIDSVGSQANRMEPIFQAGSEVGDPGIPELVPQIEVSYKKKNKETGKEEQCSVSIFEAGHRLGDAIIRSTDLAGDAREAFNEFNTYGKAQKLAELAPTSLVFGVWDSRGTQAKLPRLVQSVIRAHDIAKLTRSAQYNPPVNYTSVDVFSEEDEKKAKNNKSPLAQSGFVAVPAVKTHGGIIARGGIKRTVTINLVALRRLKSDDVDKTKILRCYILGLTLVAATADLDGFLRSGCLLVPDIDSPSEWKSVSRNGENSPIELTSKIAFSYARKAADDFEKATDGFLLGNVRRVEFNKTKAKEEAKKAKKEK